MSDLNELQEGALRALVMSPAGIPVSEMDGRVVRALERRGFARRIGEVVSATQQGAALVGEEPEVQVAVSEAEPVQPSRDEPVAGSGEPEAKVRAPVIARPVPEVKGPSNRATAQRAERVRKAYEVVSGPDATAAGSVPYAMNIALLVADVLQAKGMGAQLCGRELWAEFLRATGYHEQKDARQINQDVLRDRRESAEARPGAGRRPHEERGTRRVMRRTG